MAANEEIVRAAYRTADVHRELLRVHETGNLVVVELLVQGTFLGPLPTPAGPVMLAQMGSYPDFASAVQPKAAAH